MKLAPVLKLVRLSALPSAWADQFGGMALAAFVLPRHFDAAKIPWLLLTSLGVYLGGMALNDVLHVRKDRLQGKKRPIVTGDLSLGLAIGVTLSLFGIGIVGAVLANCLIPVLLLIVLITLYNRLAAGRIVVVRVRHSKATVAASVLVIAMCRAIHVCLPMFALIGWQVLPSRTVVPLFAGSVFVYFCLVTVVSLFEDSGGGRKALLAVSVLLLPAVLALPVYLLIQPGTARRPILGIFVPLLVLAGLLMNLWGKLDAARREPIPPKLGACVGAGIRGEALLMCGFALMLAHDQPWWGLSALAMYPAGAVLSKWISPT